MRGVYCGHMLDTDMDEKVATASHADGEETMYLTSDGYYYFMINGRIGFTEPDGMQKWIYDHSEDPAGMLERMQGTRPACRKEERVRPDSPHTSNYATSKVWYLLPILLGLIGGVIMCILLYNKNRTMAKNGLMLGVAMAFVSIMFILVSNL